MNDKWPHAPYHKFESGGTFMITSGTMYRDHIFKEPKELDIVQNTLFILAEKYGWRLEAWAIFSNHYHFIAHKPTDPLSLKKMIAHLHSTTSREINKLQNKSGRTVWHNCWDTKLTYEESYLARLSDVMKNPVKHKLVEDEKQYTWCSGAWFAKGAMKSHQITVSRFKIDQVNVPDDF